MENEANVVLLHDPSQVWLARLRPRLSSAKIRVTSTLDEIQAQARVFPSAAWILVGQTGHLSPMLDLVWSQSRRTNRACIVVIVPEAPSQLAWCFRLAGATGVQSSLRNWDGMLRIVARHFDHLPRQKVSVRTRIWKKLPWWPVVSYQASFEEHRD